MAHFESFERERKNRELISPLETVRGRIQRYTMHRHGPMLASDRLCSRTVVAEARRVCRNYPHVACHTRMSLVVTSTAIFTTATERTAMARLVD